MRHYIDLHCDTISVLERHSEYGELNENRGQVDIKVLVAGRVRLSDFCLLY